MKYVNARKTCFLAREEKVLIDEYFISFLDPGSKIISAMTYVKSSSYLGMTLKQGRYLRHAIQHHLHVQTMTLGLLPRLVATKRRPYIQVPVVLVPCLRDIASSMSESWKSGGLRLDL